jgi:hypothetical protein
MVEESGEWRVHCKLGYEACMEEDQQVEEKWWWALIWKL